LVFGLWSLVLVIGYWFLVFGYWLLVIGYWVLVFGLALVANSQYHRAVAGGCEARSDRSHKKQLRTHPLPRGGTDCSPLN
jgi:hypothetical protein